MLDELNDLNAFWDTREEDSTDDFEEEDGFDPIYQEGEEEPNL